MHECVVACTSLGGIGAFVCPTIAPTVASWPPAGAAGDFGTPGATINVANNTIVITEAHDVNGGQVQATYHYAEAASSVPTLSEWAMIALGLVVLTAGIVAIRRREKLPIA